MRRFIVRRFFTSLLVLFVVTVIIFSLSRLYGDPLALFVPEEGYSMNPEQLAKVKARLHLDRSVPVQYGYWIAQLLTGDLGNDLEDRRPLLPKLKKKFPPTLMLAGLAWSLATIVGVPLGILSAVKRGTVWDYIGRSFAVTGHSVPGFWVAIMGILIFSVTLRWLPSGTMGIDGVSWKNFVMPAAILAWLPMAGYTRLVRSSMLEILDSEFVKLARAKGVPRAAVIWKHGLRNAVIAPLTFSALLLAGLVTGSVAVETVFAWPGIAQWGVRAVFTNNLNVLVLVTMIFTLIVVIANFIADILYVVVDPRIRY